MQEGDKINQSQRARLYKAVQILDEVREEEQSKIDNAPENLMYSEKYEKMQTMEEMLDEASGLIEEVIEGI